MVYKQREIEYLSIVWPYLDKNFPKKLEQAGDRLQRESELILGYELLRNKCDLQKKSGDEGPDFLMVHQNKKIWIEVVTPNEGNYSKFKNKENFGGCEIAEINEANCKLKISSVIKDKKDKYADYQNKNVVEPEDFKIIAVNVHSFLDQGMQSCPFIVSVVYGVEEVWSFDSKDRKQKTEFWDHPPIPKPSGKTVVLGLFNQEDYQDIDGILWFNYSLGTIFPEKCSIQFLANKDRRGGMSELFNYWERIFYEGGRWFHLPAQQKENDVSISS